VKKIVYKRVSVTLDPETIRKCRSLANEAAQSVSSLIRYLVGGAYEEATADKKDKETVRDY
jgi:hypothetical protein